jgi:MYXO-CTERM domain-containing protein
MKHLRTICLVALGWPLLACDPTEPSDEGQYGLAIGLVDNLGGQSHRVLVGSEFELGITEVLVEGEVDPEGGGVLCAATSATGSLTKTDTLWYRVDAAGPGAVEFAAPVDSCPANNDVLVELGPDRWSMIGVEVSAATGKWIGAADNAALVWQTSPGRVGAFPDAIGRPLDQARVAAGGLFQLLPVLVDPSAGERAEVRWSDNDAIITVPAHYRDVATYIDYYGERQPQSYLHGTLRAGASFDSSIEILGNDFELPEVIAVPTQELTSLELVPVYAPGEPQREWGTPLGVIAITRDGEGRRVLSAPIEWSVTRGRLAAYSGNFSSDALEVADCRDEPKQPQWRGATIEAKLDDLVASVELEWIALPTDEIDPSSELCHGSACDCSTAASPRDSVFATLALLGLGGLLRRRHSS